MKTLRITFEGKTYDVAVEILDGSAPAVQTSAPAPVYAPAAATPAPAAQPAAPVAAGGTAVASPMAGLVMKIRVNVGDKVALNQEVVVLEAMKMESSIFAPSAGTITAIHVKEGDAVSEGQPMLQIG